MATDFIQIPLPSVFDPHHVDLNQLLNDAEESADGRRIVVLGQVSAQFLVNRTMDAGGKVKRPYAVHAVRGDTGYFRTWLVSSRDAARNLKKKYQDAGGTATIQDTRKVV